MPFFTLMYTVLLANANKIQLLTFEIYSLIQKIIKKLQRISFFLPFKAPFNHVTSCFTVHVNDNPNTNLQGACFSKLSHTDDLQSETYGNNILPDTFFVYGAKLKAPKEVLYLATLQKLLTLEHFTLKCV